MKFLKGVLKFIIYSILFHYKTFLRKTFNNSEKFAKVNLNEKIMTEDRGRYFYILIKYLIYSRFKVVIRADKSFFLKMNRYSKLLLNENVYFEKTNSQPSNSVVLNQLNNYNKEIKFQYKNSVGLKKVDFIFPYPMHPYHVRNFNSDLLKNLRHSKRSVKVFFAGNMIEKMYSRKALELEYNVITRYDCINFIIKAFQRNNRLELITENAKLYNLLVSANQNNKIVISRVRTEERDWLNFLSRSDFFIALPGVEHPWSHNSIEAMAVGTIPILQYPYLFYPSLDPMKNCLVYSNLNELEIVLNQALTMGKVEIEEMRRNVIDYFEKYLSPEMIINKINSFAASEANPITVSIPFMKL